MSFSTLIALVCMSTIVVLTRSASLQQGNDVDVTAYLRRFNYLSSPKKDASSWADLVPSENDLTAAVTNFQQFAGIEVTGVLDEATYYMMQQPRCGLPDIADPSATQMSGGRSKRFHLQGGKWHKNRISYRIKGYGNVATKMTRGNIDSDVKSAFGLWSRISNLRFHQVRGPADIEIVFGYIDGPYGILGMTYYPKYGGDATFDLTENWKFGVAKRGEFSFKEVATHEFGHAIGLGHSRASRTVMKPIYQPYNPYFRLEYDDILAVYYKYTVGK